jgi:hypothetical protein
MTLTSGLFALLLLGLCCCGETSAGLANAPKLGRTPQRGGPSPDVISDGIDSCERGSSSRQAAWSQSTPCSPPPSAPSQPPAAPPPAPSTATLVPAPPWQPHICISRPFSLDEKAYETCCQWGCGSCFADATPCELFPARARP